MPISATSHCHHAHVPERANRIMATDGTDKMAKQRDFMVFTPLMLRDKPGNSRGRCHDLANAGKNIG